MPSFVPWPRSCNDQMRETWSKWMLQNIEYMVWKENWPRRGYDFDRSEDALIFRLRFGL